MTRVGGTSGPPPGFLAAVAAHRAGRLGEAEAGYRAVIADLPDATPALDNLAILLRLQGRHRELVDLYETRLQIAPSDEVRYQLGLSLLHLGRYAEAWPHYEHRPLKARGAPRTEVPELRGEPLAGKSLVVWHEQGFGDQIMMARHLPLLDCDLTYACLEPLHRLFAPFVRVAPRLGRIEGRFDYWVSSMSLPGRLGTTLEAMPPPLPLAPATGSSGVGVVVSGNPEQANDANRSLSREAADLLLSRPGAVSLLPEDTGARDFRDTAEIIAGLERVITVDTAVAHLAASMGKPTDILLTASGACWRWLHGRADSPWYPSARLIRQRPGQSWTEVVAALP